jgi:LuxR family quorum sensing-dependent transcriptional regulator
MDDQYGKRALDFVEALRRCTDAPAICDLLVAELAAFGFTYVTDWTLPGPGESPGKGVLLNTRPADYVEHYVEHNLVVRDPVMTELRHTVDPFSWSDVRSRRPLTQSLLRIMDEATDFGSREGFVVPILTRSGSIAIVSACGPEPDLTPRARAALEMICIYAHEALKRTLARADRADTAQTPLTGREREIMRWVAAGKSDDEIGDILSISAATVTKHVKNAKVKLGAYRRTYAVVRAIRSGEIQI